MLRRASVSLVVFAACASALGARGQEAVTTPNAPAETTAQAGNAQIQIAAEVPRFCTVGTATLSTAAQNRNVRSLSGSVVTIDTLTDPTTLSTRAAEFGIALEAFCNYSHRLTLSSENNGLWREPEGAATPGGFASAVPYSASLDWAGTHTLLAANAERRRTAERQLLIAHEGAGNVFIDVKIEEGATNRASNMPLLAGVYRDTLRVTIEPE